MHSTKKILRSYHSLALAAVMLSFGPAQLHAQDTMAAATKPAKSTTAHYLPPNQPNAVALLAPPPLPGSAEQSADMAETVAVHAQCPPADEAAAKSEKKFFVFAFTPAIGSFFQPGKLPQTEEFLKHVEEDADLVCDAGKNYWKRPRPYAVDTNLARGADDLEKSFSYPSGHSTRGTTFALVLAELFPDKSDAIQAVTRDIGWHRVEIARHYPTDIHVGTACCARDCPDDEGQPGIPEGFRQRAKRNRSLVALSKNQPCSGHRRGSLICSSRRKEALI